VIKDSLEYMEKLMNEENEWDHRILARVKEGPEDCIMINEIAAALKKMKNKVPCLSELVAEMIQATGDVGTQWIFNLCSGIVKDSCIPENWNSSVVLPVYKWKGDAIISSYRGIKLLEHAMKLLHSFNGLFFQDKDNLSKLAPEKQNNSGFTGARDSK